MSENFVSTFAGYAVIIAKAGDAPGYRIFLKDNELMFQHQRPFKKMSMHFDALFARTPQEAYSILVRAYDAELITIVGDGALGGANEVVH